VGDHHLPRLEPGLAEGDPGRGWGIPAGLLGELPRRSRLRLLPAAHLALDHRPGPLVGACEVRPARMPDQHLQAVVESIREKTRRSHGLRHYAGRVTVPAKIGRASCRDSGSLAWGVL